MVSLSVVLEEAIDTGTVDAVVGEGEGSVASEDVTGRGDDIADEIGA